MAKISYEDVSTMSESYDGNEQGKVSFFSLKNDGDEAIVRFMHDNVNDFDINTVHDVVVGRMHRKVNCLRDPMQPVDDCPFCKAGVTLQNRMYVHMIQYVVENNAIVPKLVVWERPAASFAKKMSSMINEYGPLSDYIFKIKRCGKAGDMQTTYEIMLAHPNMYPNEKYPKVSGAFARYNSIGHAVMNKNASDMVSFLTNGSFPEVKKDEPQNNIPTNTQPSNVHSESPVVQNPISERDFSTQPTSQPTRQNPYSNATRYDESDRVTPVSGRPTRYY